MQNKISKCIVHENSILRVLTHNISNEIRKLRKSRHIFTKLVFQIIFCDSNQYTNRIHSYHQSGCSEFLQ